MARHCHSAQTIGRHLRVERMVMAPHTWMNSENQVRNADATPGWHLLPDTSRIPRRGEPLHHHWPGETGTGVAHREQCLLPACSFPFCQPLHRVKISQPWVMRPPSSPLLQPLYLPVSHSVIRMVNEWEIPGHLEVPSVEWSPISPWIVRQAHHWSLSSQNHSSLNISTLNVFPQSVIAAWS